jgi:hypothetical protein
MNQNRSLSSQHIVRMEVLDCEVVHVSGASSSHDTGYTGMAVRGGIEQVTGLKAHRGYPCLPCVIPEGMTGRGVQGDFMPVSRADRFTCF